MFACLFACLFAHLFALDGWLYISALNTPFLSGDEEKEYFVKAKEEKLQRRQKKQGNETFTYNVEVKWKGQLTLSTTVFHLQTKILCLSCTQSH